MPGQFKFSLRMKVALKNRNFNGKIWGTFHNETGYLEDVRIGQTYQKRSDLMPTCIMALKRWRETFKVNFPDRRRTCFSHPKNPYRKMWSEQQGQTSVAQFASKMVNVSLGPRKKRTVRTSQMAVHLASSCLQNLKVEELTQNLNYLQKFDLFKSLNKLCGDPRIYHVCPFRLWPGRNWNSGKRLSP